MQTSIVTHIAYNSKKHVGYIHKRGHRYVAELRHFILHTTAPSENNLVSLHIHINGCTLIKNWMIHSNKKFT